MPKLSQVLNHNVLREIVDESKPVEQIVEGLYLMGGKLQNSVHSRTYKDWNDFKRQHAKEETELVELEGLSDVNEEDVVVLRDCPMGEEMSKLHCDGKPPQFHAKVIEDYMQQNPGSNAILHPGCIAHQVARQLITKSIRFENGDSLNFYQLACRSMKTGKVVYDDNGLASVGMSQETAAKLVDGSGCLYVMVRCHARTSVQPQALEAR
jgi:hypothetical protein